MYYLLLNESVVAVYVTNYEHRNKIGYCLPIFSIFNSELLFNRII